jgi:hypothetical protein
MTATPAPFAQQTADENLKPGWNVQGTGVGQSTTGVPGEGYAVSGVVPAAPNAGLPLQAGSGFPNPPGAEFVGTEGQNTPSGNTSYTEPILENAGYASAGNNLQAAPVTIAEANLVAAGNQNPFGIAATCTVTNGATATTAQVAPFTSAPGGASSAVFGAAINLTASTTDPTVTSVQQIEVPPAGFIKFGADADIVSISWTPTN